MNKPKPERRRIFYSGRVQGVGFRYATRSVARGYAVSGFVKNLRDGRVEVVVEGQPAELDAFCTALETEMDRYIRDTQTDRQAATGEFERFDIRF